MQESINEKASVITVYDNENGKAYPWRIKWRGRVYTVTQIGYHHTREHGSTLHHIFSVVTSTLYFRLNFNTVTLSWMIEEVMDGQAN